MISRIATIAHNTFREAVRDRVLYNLIIFALLIVGASILFGQISLEINRIVLINAAFTTSVAIRPSCLPRMNSHRRTGRAARTV